METFQIAESATTPSRQFRLLLPNIPYERERS
jgi:hypothetical protein